jgi:hypothetical protein
MRESADHTEGTAVRDIGGKRGREIEKEGVNHLSRAGTYRKE